MSELANTYLARLPMELQLLLVERLKVPEITIVESKYNILSIKIKYYLTVKFDLDPIANYRRIRSDPVQLATLKADLVGFREVLLYGFTASLDLTEDVELEIKPGVYLIKTYEVSLNLVTKENMVLLINKILEYLTPITGKVNCSP